MAAARGGDHAWFDWSSSSWLRRRGSRAGRKLFVSTFDSSPPRTITLPANAATHETWCGFYFGETDVKAARVGRPIFLFSDGAVLSMDGPYVPIIGSDGLVVEGASTVQVNKKARWGSTVLQGRRRSPRQRPELGWHARSATPADSIHPCWWNRKRDGGEAFRTDEELHPHLHDPEIGEARRSSNGRGRRPDERDYLVVENARVASRTRCCLSPLTMKSCASLR